MDAVEDVESIYKEADIFFLSSAGSSSHSRFWFWSWPCEPVGVEPLSPRLFSTSLSSAYDFPIPTEAEHFVAKGLV